MYARQMQNAWVLSESVVSIVLLYDASKDKLHSRFSLQIVIGDITIMRYCYSQLSIRRISQARCMEVFLNQYTTLSP